MSELVRDLLEPAAKAAGINVESWDSWGIPHHRDKFGALVEWNPLTSDSDALRLAVKLRIAPLFSNNTPPEWSAQRDCGCARYHGNRIEVVPCEDGDEISAVRRAIVRAAAVIGRTACTLS